MRLFIWNLVSKTNKAGRPTLIVAADLEAAQTTAYKALFREFREFADTHEEAAKWTQEVLDSGRTTVTEIGNPITWHIEEFKDGGRYFAHLYVDGKTVIASDAALGKPS